MARYKSFSSKITELCCNYSSIFSQPTWFGNPIRRHTLWDTGFFHFQIEKMKAVFPKNFIPWSLHFVKFRRRTHFSPQGLELSLLSIFGKVWGFLCSSAFPWERSKWAKEKEVDYKQEIHRSIQPFKALICRAMDSAAGLFQLD